MTTILTSIRGESTTDKKSNVVAEQRAAAEIFVSNNLTTLCRELAAATAIDGALHGDKLAHLCDLCAFAGSSAQALALSMVHDAAVRFVAHPAPAKPARHIGGSILPSNDPRILRPMPGSRGTFQVRPLPELDTHGLFLGERLLASHPNGYSCHSLAERILAVWAGTKPAEHALEQFDYILKCGGLGRQREAIESLASNTNCR